MKKRIQKTLGYFDVSITRESGLEKLRADFDWNLDLLKSIHPEVRGRCVDLLEASKSQLSQNLFVLSELGFKENGCFVEFGATNGINLSNSYLLEKEFFWNGILAEPERIWHSALKQNRKAAIETKCV